jgi:uncharacterized repeat protein (TIGR01451 family)
MRKLYGLAGLGVLGTTLLGWAVLAWAQQPPGADRPAGDPLVIEPLGRGPAPATTPALPAAISGPTSGQQADPATAPAGPGPVAGVTALPEDTDPSVGQSNDNPTGRQEPAMSLEWIGPPLAKVGRPADYTLAVRNVCNIAVQQVMVRVRIPAGMTVAASEPKAVQENNVLMWELGTMMPKQERSLNVRLVADGRGTVGCQAWVTFTGASAMRVRVCEPKLAVRVTGPAKVMVGDGVTFLVSVTNPGDGPADQVKVHTTLSDGLEHPRGKNVEFPLGNLAAGETRSVQVICGTRAGGVQTCDALAEADGDLHAQDKAAVSVIMPRLDLEATGPKLRYLDRKAVYLLKVINPGDAPATNVSISDDIPPGFKFVAASDGGQHDFSTRKVTWYLGEVGPGQAKEVKLDVVAVNPGEFVHKVAATAARGLRRDVEVPTKIMGLSAILLEVVDTEDPIEVGAETSYEIRITNTGSATESNIKLVCTLPDKEQFKSATGPSKAHEQGKQIIFEPLAKLVPRADAIYRVTVRGVAAGDVRFQAQITSTNLQEPVMEQEATRIYED